MNENIELPEGIDLYDINLKKRFLGIGEWLDEPDLIKFEYEGFNCKIKRIFCPDGPGYYFGGHLCGYVTLNKGINIKDIDELDVHGGITFSDDNTIGFDCAHLHDIIPSMDNLSKKNHIFKDFGSSFYLEYFQNYKNIEFVKNELIKLVNQIIEENKIER